MKQVLITCLFAFMAGMTFASNPEDINAYVIKQESNIDVDGNYHYIYETSNRISGQEKGIGAQYSTGGYAYYSPEGELIQLNYLADENGFQPTGSHIPIAPPIPHAILKALEYIRTHPQYVEK